MSHKEVDLDLLPHIESLLAPTGDTIDTQEWWEENGHEYNAKTAVAMHFLREAANALRTGDLKAAEQGYAVAQDALIEATPPGILQSLLALQCCDLAEWIEKDKDQHFPKINWADLGVDDLHRDVPTRPSASNPFGNPPLAGVPPFEHEPPHDDVARIRALMATPSLTLDPRYLLLRDRLNALTTEQLQRLAHYQEEMVVDDVNYDGQRFCPLAVAFDLPNEFKGKRKVTDKLVRARIQELGEKQIPGFQISPTKGVSGNFYTSDRRRDLLRLVATILEHRLSANTGTGVSGTP